MSNNELQFKYECQHKNAFKKAITSNEDHANDEAQIHEVFYAYDDNTNLQYVYIESNDSMSTKEIIDLENKTRKSYMSASRVGKYFVESEIVKLDKSSKRFYKNVSFKVNRDIRKKILGYDCFQIELNATFFLKGKFEIYVTEAFNHLPIKHKIQKQFPEIADLGFPLEIISEEFYSEKVTEISNHINWELFEVDESEYKLSINPKTGFDLINKLMGIPYKGFQKILESFAA